MAHLPNSPPPKTLAPLRQALTVSGLALAMACSISTRACADEGGVSFWLPGLFASLAATPQQPGWSLSTFGYHTSVSAGDNVALSRELTLGKAKGGHWHERIENKTLGAMSMLWNGIADLMSRKDDEASGWVSLTRAEEGALALRLAGRRPIGGAWRVPTFLIDASLDEDLLRPSWSTVEVTGRIEVETPHQRITQIAHPFSKDMLAPREKSDPAKEARRAKNRLKVSAFIQKLDRQGGKTLVVSNKATAEALKLPSFIETAHFNSVAGKDVWGDVDPSHRGRSYAASPGCG